MLRSLQLSYYHTEYDVSLEVITYRQLGCGARKKSIASWPDKSHLIHLLAYREETHLGR